VLDGSFDLGILGPPPANTPELELVPLFPRAASPSWSRSSNHLVGRSSVTLRDIATEPLILPPVAPPAFGGSSTTPLPARA